MHTYGFSPLPLTAALLACLTVPAAARADAIDDAVRAEMKRLSLPGVSVVITRDDRVVKKAAYGETDIENHVRATPEHLFETGSIGKTLTATLALQLVGEGRLSLDDPISKRFDRAPASWEKITIRSLLAQTSGLPDYALVPGLGLIEKWTLEQWIDKIIALPLDFPPNSQHAYSNTNYFLLGLILQKVGGKPFEELLTERVLKPAGMTHTRFSHSRDIIERRAHGYYPLPPSPEGDRLINAAEMSETGTGADGGLIGTAEDLAAFERAFREGKLVPLQVAQQMQTATRLPDKRKAGYGLGWFVGELWGNRERPWLSHAGNTAGFSASISRFPSERLTVAVVCNMANVPGDNLALKIAQAVAPSLKPPVYKEEPDPDASRTERVRTALAALGRGETNGESLDPAYRERLATGRGRMAMGAYAPLATIESLRFLGALTPDPESGDTLLRYRARPTQKNAPSLIVAVVLTCEGRVFSVALRPEA